MPALAVNIELYGSGQPTSFYLTENIQGLAQSWTHISFSTHQEIIERTIFCSI